MPSDGRLALVGSAAPGPVGRHLQPRAGLRAAEAEPAQLLTQTPHHFNADIAWAAASLNGQLRGRGTGPDVHGVLTANTCRR